LDSPIFFFFCWSSAVRPTPNLEDPISMYLCPLVTGWPRHTPRHRVPFSSPYTTRRATVEVFWAASTRDTSPSLS
jgi:hypothetical protein